MDDNFIHDVGQRIRKIRRSKRMTMKELAEKTDLHESTISRYEKGEIAMEIGKLKEIAKALDVDASYLCGWTTTDTEQIQRIIKRWIENVGELIFSDEELDELMDYAKYILSKRK